MRKNKDTSIYTLPVSIGYWKAAAAEFRCLRSLMIAAVFTALSAALGMLRVPVGENLYIFLTFFVKMTGAAIYGPLVGLAAGFAGDIVGYLMYPQGAYFFGYTLSSMAGIFIYCLFLYRTKISAVRIFAAKLTVNILVNILLGSFWSAMLFSKGYLYYLFKSIVKNIALWPLESLLFVLFIGVCLPVLVRRGYLYGNPDGKLFSGRYPFRPDSAAFHMKWVSKVLSAAAAVFFIWTAALRMVDAPTLTAGLRASVVWLIAAAASPFVGNFLYGFGVMAEDLHTIRKSLEQTDNSTKSDA
ncbi:folate family ECF transporter S component [Phocea massiliensis]|uniref:Folate family ECF transporter S component n=1 Tax=Merdimmobilis hominis TaxID=2897707 RepID=A0A938X796_9FIRM|nr:folate family ECF transporter S component [Merdimmobilis hominis]MBM6920430.1 folate family ECF transporter S component [Merdimmobilis hominis]